MQCFRQKDLKVSESTLRHIKMLELIPRRPPGITAPDLRGRLSDRNFEVNLRTVQRDLNYLSSVLPIASEGERPQYWFWAADATPLSIPAQDAHSALMWRLIEEHLRPLLPRAIQRDAEPQFAVARAYLQSLGEGKVARWKERVRVIPRAFQLQVPEIPIDVMAAVQDALFQGCQLQVEYRSRGAEKSRSWRTHPLGLVMREGILYILATIEDYTDLRQLVAHRIDSASVIDEPVQEPEHFDLDAYIKSGGFSYVETGPIRLRMRVDAYAAEHILESPIAPDQKSKTLPDGRSEITATVVDTKQLRWWLTGFSDALEVVEPLELRTAMAEQAEAVARLYSQAHA